jgi:hypothetical protein
VRATHVARDDASRAAQIEGRASRAAQERCADHRQAFMRVVVPRARESSPVPCARLYLWIRVLIRRRNILVT